MLQAFAREGLRILDVFEGGLGHALVEHLRELLDFLRAPGEGSLVPEVLFVEPGVFEGEGRVVGEGFEEPNFGLGVGGIFESIVEVEGADHPTLHPEG